MAKKKKSILTATVLRKEKTVPAEYRKSKNLKGKNLVTSYKKHVGAILTSAVKKYDAYNSQNYGFTSEYKELSTMLSSLNISTRDVKSNNVENLRKMLNNPANLNDYFNTVAILEKVAQLPTPAKMKKKLQNQFKKSAFNDLNITFEDYINALNNIENSDVFINADDGKMIYTYYDVYVGDIVETSNKADVANYVKSVANLSNAQYQQIRYNRLNAKSADKSLAQSIADMFDDDIEI